MILNAVLILLSEVLNSNVYIIWLFTYLAIYSDFFFSQRKNYFVNFAFKLLLLISSLLLYQNFLDPIYVLKIKIISIYFTFLFYFLLCKKSQIISLKVYSPLIFNLLTCCIYYFSLIIITIVISDIFLKFVYISFQILIGIHLKLFDLKIRDINLNYLNFEIIFRLASFSYIICLALYLNLYLLIVFYITIFLILNFLEKKYITSKY